MENNTSWLERVKKLFQPSKEKLQKEAERRANEVFNIVQEDGLTFITYRDIKVSPKKYGNASQEMLENLYELRKMFIEQYVKMEGRIYG